MAAEAAPGGTLAKLAAYRAALDAGAEDVPGGRGAVAAARPGRIARSGRARAGQRRRIDPLLREGAGACAGAFRRASLPDPRLREHRPDAARRWPRARPMRRWRRRCRTRGTCTAHNLRRVGRIDEAIAEFRAADALRDELLRGGTDSGRVRLALPAQSRSAGDLVSVRRPDGEGRGAVQAIVRRSASSLVVQEFNKREWPEFLLARGRAARGARRGERAGRASVAGGQRDRARRGGARAAGARPVQGGGRRGQHGAAPDARRARGRRAGRRRRCRRCRASSCCAPGRRSRGGRCSRRWRGRSRARAGPDAWTQALFTLEAIARAAREVGDWDFAGVGGAADARARSELRRHRIYALALVAEHRGDAQDRGAPSGRWWRSTGTAPIADVLELENQESR